MISIESQLDHPTSTSLMQNEQISVRYINLATFSLYFITYLHLGNCYATKTVYMCTFILVYTTLQRFCYNMSYLSNYLNNQISI